MVAQLDLQPVAAQMDKKPDAFMVLVDKLKGMPPEAISSVLESYKQFIAIQAKQAFDEAMALLKKNMPAIVKSKLADMNGKYSYHYAELHKDVCSKLDPVLEAHGFGYRWTTHPNEKGVTLGCILYHVQGHQEETLMPPAPHDNSGGKNSIQAIGSTLSYLQRYSLLMALGIAPKNVDTDGVIADPEMPGLEDWCTSIRDAHSFEEMDQSFRQAFSEASRLKNKTAKDALAAARDDWRKRTKAGAR